MTSPTSITLAVDCMGGDHGPQVTLPACRAFVEAHPDVELLLVGTAEAIAPAAGWARCTTIAATEIVAMDDPVETALRRKRDSSMRVAIQQLKADRDGNPALAHACVSAGNTGALMARGADVWSGVLDTKPKGACTQAFPMYGTSRIVAGGPIEGGIFKCALKPLDNALADGTYGTWKPNAAEIQKLQAIFPEGVCDFASPGQGSAG
eukprot:gene52136-69757_t